MTAPFWASVDYSEFNETRVRIKNPGQSEKTVQPPFEPFVVCPKQHYGQINEMFHEDIVGVHTVTGRPLSEIHKQEQEYYILCFKHPYNVSALNKTSLSKYVMDNKIPYLWNISRIASKWYSEYSYQKDDINTVFLDIEQSSSGGFPKPEDPIVSIAAARNNDEVVVWTGDSCVMDFHRWLNDGPEIDMIVTFYGNYYDLPVLSAHGDFSQYWTIGTDSYNNDRPIANPVDGVILFDLNESAQRDQTLTGISKRGLKEVAQWKRDRNELPSDLEVIKEDRTNIDQLSEERLIKYNRNDVLLTRALFDVYFEQVHYLHQFLQVPLNQMFPIADSFPAKIVTSKIFWENKIFMDKTNHERYPELFQRDDEEKPFEGASVGISKTGRHSPVWHNDVSSLYPSIIFSLGIGPDNLYLEGWEPQVQDGPTYDKETETFYIPDENVGKTAIIKKIGESQYAKYFYGFYQKRLKLKTDPTKKTICNGYKVILNSVYGLNGSRTTRYGSAAVGMLITAIGRYIMNSCLEKYSDIVIEHDTDGIYFDSPLEPEKLENFTNDMIVNEFDAEPLFKWDQEIYQAGLFYKAKNYLLLKRKSVCDSCKEMKESLNGCDRCQYTVKRAGVSMKGSQHPPFFNDLVMSLGKEILLNGYTTELYDKAKELKELDFDIEQFAKSRKLGKPVQAYVGNDLSVTLAKRYENHHGIVPEVGEQFDFVVVCRDGTCGQYILLEEFDPKRDRIDTDYYRDTVDKVLERLDINFHEQLSFNDFM